jgi:hypothetical protein
MNFQCLQHVIGARWGIPAIVSHPGRNSRLIKPYQHDQREYGNFPYHKHKLPTNIRFSPVKQELFLTGSMCPACIC